MTQEAVRGQPTVLGPTHCPREVPTTPTETVSPTPRKQGPAEAAAPHPRGAEWAQAPQHSLWLVGLSRKSSKTCFHSGISLAAVVCCSYTQTEANSRLLQPLREPEPAVQAQAELSGLPTSHRPGQAWVLPAAESSMGARPLHSQAALPQPTGTRGQRTATPSPSCVASRPSQLG